MATATPTVSERLIRGTVALIEADGDRDLSVRRLAEASERSTMCVYTYFQGRANLLAAAHAEASAEVIASLSTATDPLAALDELARSRPRLLLWLVTAEESPTLRAQRDQVARDLLGLLPDGPAEARAALAQALGQAVLQRLTAHGAEPVSG